MQDLNAMVHCKTERKQDLEYQQSENSSKELGLYKGIFVG